MDWTASQVNEATAQGKIFPLYYFYGDESFLIDEAVAQLQTQALGAGIRDFNFTSFYADEVDAAQIRDAVETLPMMTDRRVVVVKNAHEFTEKDWDYLLPLIESPVESTALICVATKLDKRKKHSKRFLEKGVVVEFKRPFDNQVPDWIRSIAKRQALTLNSDVVDVLHQLIGSSLTDINAELLKLKMYIGDRKQVTIDDVLKSVSHLRFDSVFDLTEAIGCNDRARALTNLANLLDQGQNEVGIVALISRHFRILKLVGEGVREGLSGARLAARAGVSPYFLKSYIEQAKAWNEREIEHTFQALLDTDRALKSFPVSSHIWLENFILQTCS